MATEQPFFLRTASLTIGTVKIEGHRIAFDVEKNNQIEPNQGKFSVWNLGPETRAYLQTKGLRAEFAAGYGTSQERIFSGDVFYISHVHEGADWVTKICAGDGHNAKTTSKSYESFPTGSKVGTVVEKLVADLQKALNPKHETKKGFVASLVDGAKVLVNGFSTAGNLGEELNNLAKSNGLEVSIQDGVVQVTQNGKPAGLTAFVLSSDTGLKGNPEIGEDGTLKAQSFLNSGMNPGALVEMRAEAIKGFFVVQKSRFSGDTFGPDFVVEVEGRKYK